jgi:hypothetical protein
MTAIKINAATRLKATKILHIKFKKLPVPDHIKSHYGSLLKKFPELLKGESIPVFKHGIPGREKYTVTNEKGTDTPWNDDAGAAFTFTEDEVNSVFELS